MYVTALIFLLIGSFVGGKFTCPKLQTLNNFQHNKISGKWYCYKQYYFVMSSNVRCMNYEITSDDPKFIFLDIDAVNKTDNAPVYMSVTLFSVRDPKQTLYSEVVQRDRSRFTMPMQVLSTDYDNYTIYFSCNKNSKEMYSWILTRAKEVSKSVDDEINDVLEKNNIDLGKYEPMDQNDCPN